MGDNCWRVIIVDDNYDDREVLLTILDYYKIEAYGVDSATECVALLEQVRPHAVITDLAMPNTDGWGVLDLVRQHDATSQTVVVAITAYHSEELAEKAMKGGFDAYFSKPINPAQFIQRLEALILR